MSQLAKFRATIDEFLATHPQSPLAPQQQSSFQGLAYFDGNAELQLTVDVERFPTGDTPVEMATSTGDMRMYRRWGQFRFTVDDTEAHLIVYSNDIGDELFLPFRDATNGAETYGAGRYLDNHRPGLKPMSDGRLLVDFNYAYNPYCAYSPAYSCPLPPRENWLKIPIRAGEKIFSH